MAHKAVAFKIFNLRKQTHFKNWFAIQLFNCKSMLAKMCDAPRKALFFRRLLRTLRTLGISFKRSVNPDKWTQNKQLILKGKLPWIGDLAKLNLPPTRSGITIKRVALREKRNPKDVLRDPGMHWLVQKMQLCWHWFHVQISCWVSQEAGMQLICSAISQDFGRLQYGQCILCSKWEGRR